MLDALLGAVQGDMERYQRHLKHHTMDIAHCLQIIRKITEKG